MKITCQSCGKRYDTDVDELCPKCGSYNPINRETADPNGSYAEEKSYQDHGKYRWEPQQQEQEEPEDQKKQISWKPKSRPVQQNVPSLEKNKGKGGCLGFIFSRLAIFCVVLMLVQQGCEFLREPIRRQVMEQIVAKTSIPPFMLGLNWNSTERMSAQQADMLTTEITAIRRTLTPVVEQICRMWLRMQGETAAFRVDWEDINLQDEVEEAKAELYREQARKLRIENDAAEKQK